MELLSTSAGNILSPKKECEPKTLMNTHEVTKTFQEVKQKQCSLPFRYMCPMCLMPDFTTKPRTRRTLIAFRPLQILSQTGTMDLTVGGR